RLGIYDNFKIQDNFIGLVAKLVPVTFDGETSYEEANFRRKGSQRNPMTQMPMLLLLFFNTERLNDRGSFVTSPGQMHDCNQEMTSFEANMEENKDYQEEFKPLERGCCRHYCANYTHDVATACHPGLMGDAERKVLIQEENEEGLERQGELLSQGSHGNNVNFSRRHCGYEQSEIIKWADSQGCANEENFINSGLTASSGETMLTPYSLSIITRRTGQLLFYYPCSSVGLVCHHFSLDLLLGHDLDTGSQKSQNSSKTMFNNLSFHTSEVREEALALRTFPACENAVPGGTCSTQASNDAPLRHGTERPFARGEHDNVLPQASDLQGQQIKHMKKLVTCNKYESPSGTAPIRCAARATNSVVELVALSKATALAACRCQPTHLSVLVDRFGDPLGVRVSSDSFMEWIDEDNLIKFVCGIFANPPSLHALSGRVGRGARCSADSWRYCQQQTLGRKRITSDCFFRHSSWIILGVEPLDFGNGLVVRWRAAVAPPLMNADRLKLNHLELEEGIPFIGNAFMLPKQIHGELPVSFALKIYFGMSQCHSPVPPRPLSGYSKEQEQCGVDLTCGDVGERLSSEVVRESTSDEVKSMSRAALQQMKRGDDGDNDNDVDCEGRGLKSVLPDYVITALPVFMFLSSSPKADTTSAQNLLDHSHSEAKLPDLRQTLTHCHRETCNTILFRFKNVQGLKLLLAGVKQPILRLDGYLNGKNYA
ncbi:hypothetical protein U0070_026520, partial [Myodes glareolus]